MPKSTAKVISKRFGGTERAEKARKDLREIFSDTSHQLYFEKDITFARKYDVSRHTIYKIRDELKIPTRSERILRAVRVSHPEKHTLKQLSQMLNIKYQNLYKVIQEYDIRVKPDVQPIEKLKEYQKERKRKRLMGGL